MRHYCTRRPNKWFQWGEKKQTVHVMLQFQPLYELWLEFQNTHWRPQRENVILGDVLAQGGKKMCLCGLVP